MHVLSLINLTGASLTGWYIGLAIAAVAIAVVVVLVAIIMTMARRISIQAAAITAALDQARVNTLALWDVERVNSGLTSIVGHAAAARGVLEERL